MDVQKLLDQLEEIVLGNREAERLIEDLRDEVDLLVAELEQAST